jgi:hypothetical protein
METKITKEQVRERLQEWSRQDLITELLDFIPETDYKYYYVEEDYNGN